MARHLTSQHLELLKHSGNVPADVVIKAEHGRPSKRKKTVEDHHIELSSLAHYACGRLQMLIQGSPLFQMVHQSHVSALVQEFCRGLALFYQGIDSPSVRKNNPIDALLDASSIRMPPEYLAIWQLALQDSVFYPLLCWHACRGLSELLTLEYRDVLPVSPFPIPHDPFAHSEKSPRAKERLLAFYDEFERLHHRRILELASFYLSPL
ncbi:hypothetical protein HDU91_005861 [Kappamyces sp. JEL0680]|nr:hypothetical protein HDU91_005861 [Kappamyces sp. JEL0680]